MTIWKALRNLARSLASQLPGHKSRTIRHLSRAELFRALLKGCPPCILAAEATDRFIFWFLNEYYGEAAWVDRLVKSAGFCRHHTWMLVSRHAPYRLSYVALYIAQSLIQAGPQAWGDPAPCPLCNQLAAMAHQWCRDLAALLQEDSFAAQYKLGPGLCYTHLQMTLAYAPSSVRTLLLSKHAAILASGTPPPREGKTDGQA